MKRLNWQSDSQYADLVATGCPTIGALAELRGVPTATVIHRLKAGLVVAAATDASLRRPPIAATKRRSTLLNAHQLAAIESLGFDSVRALSMSSALAEGTIYNRLRRGWTVEAAISTPARITEPLAAEKLAELHELGFASAGEVARAAGLTLTLVWSRWVRRNWPLTRVIEEPVRPLLIESKAERGLREEAERRTRIRTCVRCRLNAPIGDYRRSAQSSNGRLRVCGSCLSFSIIEDRYGLDREAYDDLWRQQQGRCFGCATDLAASTCRVHVDHDHRTGVVRGLACAFCNWTLGDFRDEPKHLLAAVGWLDANPGVAQLVQGEPQRSPGGDPRGYTLWRDHCMSVDDLRLLLASQGRNVSTF